MTQVNNLSAGYFKNSLSEEPVLWLVIQWWWTRCDYM